MKNSFLRLSRLQKQLIAASADFVCVPLIFCMALLLHKDSAELGLLREYQWLIIAAAIAAIPVFFHVGLYRAVIRYIDQKIIAAIVAGSTLTTLILLGAANQLAAPTMSVTPFLMYWIMCIMYANQPLRCPPAAFAGAKSFAPRARGDIWRRRSGQHARQRGRAGDGLRACAVRRRQPTTLKYHRARTARVPLVRPRAPVPHTLHRYGAAGHAFHHPPGAAQDTRPSGRFVCKNQDHAADRQRSQWQIACRGCAPNRN